MTMRTLSLGLVSASLVTLLACGGSGSRSDTPHASTSISYTNPTGVPTTSYYLNKSTALSTPSSHLVLELFGPATTVVGSGVVLTLDLDTTKATWGHVSGSSPVANGSVFANNANGAPIVQGRVTGGRLQVVVTERGAISPKALTGPLLEVALDLNSGVPSGTAITLTPDLTTSKAILGTTISGLPDLRIGTITTQ